MEKLCEFASGISKQRTEVRCMVSIDNFIETSSKEFLEKFCHSTCQSVEMASDDGIQIMETESAPDIGASCEISGSSKRGKRGPAAVHWVWEYFKDSENGKNKVCNFCSKEFKGKYSNNCEGHLLSRHKDREKEFQDKKAAFEELRKKQEEDENQPKIKAFCASTKSKTPQGRYTPHQLRKLAILLGATSMAYSIVDSEEFEDFCKSLQLDFIVPDKKTVLKEMGKVYLQLKQRIQDRLACARKILLCVDEWTNKGMTMALVGVTAHFYNRQTHELNRILLGLRRIQHPKTADRIRQLVLDLLNEWEIPESKVWRIITDNAKNMEKAFHSSCDDYTGVESVPVLYEEGDPNLDESFDEDIEEEYYNGKDDSQFQEAFDKQKHLACFLHTLVLAFKIPVTSEDSEVYQAKKDASRLVNVFSHSSKATERLIEITGKKLLLPAKTRWNYIYHMLKRLIELRQGITEVCEEQRIHCVSNWRILIDLVTVLEPFANMIDYLQGQTYVTIAQALPCIDELLEHLEEQENKGVLPTLCGQIKSEIKRRFKDFLSLESGLNPTYIIAAALHPTLARLQNKDRLTYAHQALVRFMRSESNGTSETEPRDNPTVITEEIEEDLSCVKLFPHLKKKLLEGNPDVTATVTSVEEEVTKYFKELCTFRGVKDPLQFWEQKRPEFPQLSDFALDVLAIPASSAAVESVFSVAGHSTSGRRHSLTVNLEREVMIKVNKFCLR